MKKILLSIATIAIFSIAANAQKAGADKDAHGCIGSAGYTFSVIKNKCIRTFEEKIQLKEVVTKGNFIAAVIVSDDKSKAEIFLKDNKEGIILKRTAKTNSWTDGVYTLEDKKGYSISKNKKVIYK